LTHPVTVQDYISQLQPVIDVYGIGLAVIEELEKSAISGLGPQYICYKGQTDFSTSYVKANLQIFLIHQVAVGG
jgi:hypothetical protein